MICTKHALKVLTKKQQAHLTDHGFNSHDSFRHSIDTKHKPQLEKNRADQDALFFHGVCEECHEIAQRLGIL